MQYDPIKRVLGNIFNHSTWSRKLFYQLLDLLLLRTWHIKKAIRKWSRTIDGAASILDAGSGFGQYSYFLARKNPSWQILGVDVKEEQIEDCQHFFKKTGLTNANFLLADLTKFIHQESYDLILSVDVMEHIEEDGKVFSNFYQSLKKNGLLLISTPSDKGGSDVHHTNEKHDQKISFIDEHVRDGYSVEEITTKLKNAGFSKVDVAYSYGWPGKISWKLSMKYPISLLNVSKLFFIILPIYYLAIYWFALLMNLLDINLNHNTGTGLIVKAQR
ncbi:MAG: class I SAM-dependent methyltransferase [Bacteroidales bacterium]|nr:class I SAM-dependent methyltransferase [Bacteroidales bacterium]